MPEVKPLVAIVGRPNVGKSTLFNRMVGGRRAITSEEAGTTRDRIYADVKWRDRTVTVIDTGGLRPEDSAEGIDREVNAQVGEALAEADAILFVVDAAAGLHPEDRAVAERLRRAGSSVILVANKVDSQARKSDALEFTELGIGEPIAVSAYHGRNVGDLLDRVLGLPVSGRAVRSLEEIPRVAIVGRPNVGKSTLVNQLSGKQRAVTSDEPGTTRDVTDIVVDSSSGPMQLLDTAGMRRRGKTGRGIGKYSLLRTIRAINEADVVAMLIDAEEGPTVQDAHIMSYVLEAAKAMVLVVNKWDVVEKGADIQEQWHARLQERYAFLPSPPIVFLSALTGEKLDRLAQAVYDVWKLAATKVPTPELNRLLEEKAARLPGKTGKHAPKLYYAAQVGTRPPVFRLFVNKTAAWTDTRRRYLTNALRDRYGLWGVSIRLQIREREREARR